MGYSLVGEYSGLAPQYLVEDWIRNDLYCVEWGVKLYSLTHSLVAATDRRQLRSSDIATFVIPRTYTRLGDQALPVAGPRLWNSIPSNLRQSDLTLQQFRRSL